MELKTITRDVERKSGVKKLRREGYIPSVIYAKGKAGEPLAISSNQFQSFLRNLKPGHLPTTVFTLVDENGKERKALIKDIQYEVTTYAVIHLDFEELVPGQHFNVKVPIECIGTDNCPGIKGGGVLRQVIRHALVRVSDVQDLPEFFELNVRDLSMNQTKRLKDLQIPENVRPLSDLNEVAVVIVKK